MRLKSVLLPIAAVLALGWLLLFRPRFLGGTASYIIVSGVSMMPTLYNGDLAVLQAQPVYEQGDIIAFAVPGGNVIHRIVGGSAEEGYITQGDNKNEVDPWHPRPENILGKMWFYVSGGGRVLQRVRQPHNLAALGGLAAILLLSEDEKKPERRRRRRVKMDPKHKASGTSAPLWGTTFLSLFVLLALALAAGAGYSLRQPLVKKETVERLRYEHTASFAYAVHTEPSILYPDGLIAGSPSTPQVYTRLARSVDVDFAYTLASALPPEVHGEIGAVFQIKAGEGWTKESPLVPTAAFTGTTASIHATVVFSETQALIQSIEAETGFNAGTYEIAIIPTVRVVGQIAQRPINEMYAPAFTMTLNQTKISFDAELRRNEVKTVTEEVVQRQEIRLWTYAVPVATARRWGLMGAALSGLAATLLALVVFVGLGRGEIARLQARYGSMLVSVAQVDFGDEAQRIYVASMEDLAKLANRDGRIIFHQELAPESHRYFVHDGDVVCIYPAPADSEKA